MSDIQQLTSDLSTIRRLDVSSVPATKVCLDRNTHGFLFKNDYQETIYCTPLA